MIVAMAVILSVSAFAASPEIISQPQNFYFPASVTLPERASFSVMASGENLSYQWQVMDSNGWRDVASGGNAATYTPLIYNNGANGGFLFRVIVTNSEGSTISEAVSVSVGAYILESIPQMLASGSEVINGIFGWVVSACSCIISTPLLLIGVSFFALGASIAILSRLLSRS